jgi:hypothetical protein
MFHDAPMQTVLNVTLGNVTGSIPLLGTFSECDIAKAMKKCS